MRISDWSSDVCSSDLSGRLPTVSRLPYERPRCRHWRSQQGGKIMAAALPSSPPTWFRIVALLAVLWNAFGVAMYLSSVGIFGDPMAGLSEAERAEIGRAHV